MLTCPGPPEHEFENPNAGKRGRPPRYCSEHKPEKPESNSSSNSSPSAMVVTDVTDAASNPFIKKAIASRDNPFVKKAQAQQEQSAENSAAKRDRMAKARAEKAKKAQERAQKNSEEIEAEYMEIDDRIKAAKEHYDHTHAATKAIEWSRDTEKEFNKIWATDDRAMSNFMQVLKRKRELEAIIEQLTNPDSHSHEEIHTPNMNMLDPDEQDRMMDELDDATELLAEDDRRKQNEYQYNDLLSNPEQFDDPMIDQFSSILAEFEDE